MKINMGTADRFLRIAVVVLIAILYFTNVISGTLVIILSIIAVVFLLTSFIGFCLIYHFLGISTKEKETIIHHKNKQNMAHEIEVQWMDKMQFNALVNGHT